MDSFPLYDHHSARSISVEEWERSGPQCNHPGNSAVSHALTAWVNAYRVAALPPNSPKAALHDRSPASQPALSLAPASAQVVPPTKRPTVRSGAPDHALAVQPVRAPAPES